MNLQWELVLVFYDYNGKIKKKTKGEDKNILCKDLVYY